MKNYQFESYLFLIFKRFVVFTVIMVLFGVYKDIMIDILCSIYEIIGLNYALFSHLNPAGDS